MAKKTEWSQEKIQILINNYKNKSYKELRQILGISSQVILAKLKEMGIKKGFSDRDEWTKEQDEYLRNNHKEKSNLELANDLGRTESSIGQRLSRLKLKRERYAPGNKFGRLTIIETYKETSSSGNVRYRAICQCDCENETIVTVDTCNLKTGATQSCSCYWYEQVVEANRKNKTTHGDSGTPLHRKWHGMICRCHQINPGFPDYDNYRGRGIVVCEEWHDYPTFKTWAISVGLDKNPELTIERINNNGNYEPGNCKLITRGEQVNNRRNTTYAEIFGIRRSVADWAQHPLCPVDVRTLGARVRAGWDHFEAFGTPKGGFPES